ncbi:hypothetical protein J5N97_026785 [Dioscorea zingiberensis]|uniref:Fibronectin type-III domain-containing protein n=1 Tax=Dioscorea zingiberensis TaxID=325984 RepID=A0A9D5C2U7_9LILI|nr:hypothetical protein J5N97_026785 [Dioscorea zingiberensis]
MDPPFSGFVLDPSKCRSLSIEERRDLIHELAKWPESAPEKLQKWSRRDLLEILCAEMGKERKYTGLTKQKLIEFIFRIVAEKKPGEPVDVVESAPHPPPSNQQTQSKRQRKSDHPSRLPVGTNNLAVSNESEAFNVVRYCTNLACRATISLKDSFCKRCSCCLCHKYDDNKDPSLWLVCSPETPSQGDSCGMSCHLECALKHEKAGILQSEQCMKLDGSYYCTYCGKVNDLLGCWRKQLMIAKDARRVDVLCYRVYLSHKLINLTEKFKSLHEIVEEALKKLEAEVGTLDGLPNMARGIVNRLPVGAEVQKLCARAIVALDSMQSANLPADIQIQKSGLMLPGFIKLEEVSSTSVTVVLGPEDSLPSSQELISYMLWHRKVDAEDYPMEPDCTIYEPQKRFLITGLTPANEYVFKVVAFSNTRELEKWEIRVKTEGILRDVEMNSVDEGTSPRPDGIPKENSSSGLSNSNPSSEGDESNNAIAYTDLNKSPDSCFGYSEKPEVLDLEKPADDVGKDVGHSKNSGGLDTVEPEEPRRFSVAALNEEPNSAILTESQRDSDQTSDVPKSDNESNAPVQNEIVVAPYRKTESSLPVTPCRMDTFKEGLGRSGRTKPGINGLEDVLTKPEKEPLAGSSSKKRAGAKCEEVCPKGGLLEGEYEYCVKVIRWLECEGHIETNFRVKFLTWFSLRATSQERKIVSVYIDTLIDDAGSLAGQLVDTFSEAVCSKRSPLVPTGFCMQLWH